MLRFTVIKKYCILLIYLLLCICITHAQEGYVNTTHLKSDTSENIIRINKKFDNIEVHFRFDKYNLDLSYMGNDASLQDFAHKIDSIGISRIDSIVIVSQSSPEGVYEHNLMLSRNRANTMRKYILGKHPELKDILFVHPDGESWGRLREYVLKDTMMKESTIEKVVSVIDADVNVGTKKWRMQQLPIYRYLLRTYYPRIRNSSFYILYYTEVKPVVPVVEVIEPEPVIEIEEIKPDTTAIAPPVVPPVETAEEWTRRLYVKTNAIGLGMGIANIGAEIDLAKHLSFTLPVYYSAWDYFKSTIKFRTLAIQPELRYWFSEENDGVFAGAHFGMAYYNFAFNGDYRYQDHDGTKPSLGGGISLGYRMPISKNNRWRMELSIGAGVYSRYYDKFHNTPNTKDGLMIESIKKCYWGIDQAAVSFSYTFDLKKKGGKQ